MEDALKLYYSPGTCALACWISLEWSKVDYEVQSADPSSEAFRRINPLGAVPALDIGGSRAMTQAGAILQYIVERYPEKGLGPDPDVVSRFEFNETMSFLTGDFHPAFWPFFSPQRYTTQRSEGSLDAVRAASHERVDRVMQHLNALIGTSGHVYKGRRSVADAYAFVMARWSVNFPKTWRDYPNIAPFMNRMNSDDAVSRILERSKK